jgi:hypothetical protein
MFDLFKRYVDEGYMKFDKGNVWFGKEGITLYFTQFTATELYLNRRIGGSRYLATKFAASRKEGLAVVQQHGAPSMKELTSPLNVILKIMGILGMGTFKVVEADSAEGFAVLTGVTTLGLDMKAEKASDDPIDFVVGGLIAGAVEYYTKKRAYAVETSCVAQKDQEECTWLVGSRESIVGYVQKSLPEKIGLANRALDQIQALEKELEGNVALSGLV